MERDKGISKAEQKTKGEVLGMKNVNKVSEKMEAELQKGEHDDDEEEEEEDVG